MKKKVLKKKTGSTKAKKVKKVSGTKSGRTTKSKVKKVAKKVKEVKKVKKKVAKPKVKKVKKVVKKVKKVEKKVKKKVTKPKVKRVKKITKPKVKVKEKKIEITTLPPTPKRISTPEEMVEEAKYFEPVEIRYPPKEELPREYGENKIVIMARDPNWAFAYWEMTHETLETARKKTGEGANLTLRVYDVTGIDFNGENALSSFDIGVYERVGDWYIELRKPDRSFCVDVGLLNPEGSFITIARSNVITTPRDKVSEITDERFMIMEEEFQRVFALSGGYGVGLSSPELQEIIKKRFAAEIFSPKK
jgi:hypothetical protein